MALATGGSAVGAISMRSRPMSCARRTAAGVGMISTDPSGKTARTSFTRIASLTFSRILGRRGGRPLGGYMPDLTVGADPRLGIGKEEIQMVYLVLVYMEKRLKALVS